MRCNRRIVCAMQRAGSMPDHSRSDRPAFDAIERVDLQPVPGGMGLDESKAHRPVASRAPFTVFRLEALFEE